MINTVAAGATEKVVTRRRASSRSILFGVTRMDPEGRACRLKAGGEKSRLAGADVRLDRGERLRKRFGDIEALAGVSFHVAAGEIYGLLGPNGAGKSTTINILCGLIRPDGGEARLSGIDVVQRPVDARRVLGVVPQEVALYSDLSARDNLAFFGKLYGLRGAALSRRIHTVLEQVDLADRAKEPIERYPAACCDG